MTISLQDKASGLDNKFTVALDGPSAAGKGLIASMLAQRFNLVYFQSSILYRGLSWLCLKNNISIDDDIAVVQFATKTDILNSVISADINDEHIGTIASKISSITELRQYLNHYQQDLMKSTPRIIMEGRDIGTVIAPWADLKIFITANVEIRAARRFKQLRQLGKTCTMEQILRQLIERDERDETRITAPLKPSPEALIIDSSSLEPEQVIEIVENYMFGK